MIVSVKEYDGCYSIDIKPESVAEAATLIRLGVNGTREIRSLSASASASGAINACVVLGKRKRSVSVVKAGKW